MLRHCDIVIPVYNNLSYARTCLDTVIRYTPKERYHLYIIDDGSDAHTGNRLKYYTRRHTNITYNENNHNLGFVKSCNLGIRLGQAPYVVLLNSDVVVTPNWLDRLILCAESDDRIAFVNPLTNTAEQIALPMPPGSDFMDMYRRINHRIVKSTWLKNLLAKDRFEAYKISLGMDLDRFYPRDDTTDHPVVMAMVRPKTPRRGFQTTIDALAQIKQARPETEIILFGDRFYGVIRFHFLIVMKVLWQVRSVWHAFIPRRMSL